MNNIMKSLATVALFGVTGPPIGFSLLLLYTVLSMPAGKNFPIAMSDFIYSIVEFGIPCALGGLLFFLAEWFFARRSTSRLHATTHGLIGAATFALLFTLPIASRFITHGYWHRLFMLIAVFATITGFVLGLVCPKAWLRRDSDSLNVN